MPALTTTIATTAIAFGWSWLPPGPVAYFDRSMTHTIATTEAWEEASLLMPLVVTQPEIGVLVAAQALSVRKWAQDADNNGKCLKITASGILFGDSYTGGNCH